MKCNNCGACYTCRVNAFKSKMEDEALNYVMEQHSEENAPDLNDFHWQGTAPTEIEEEYVMEDILHSNAASTNHIEPSTNPNTCCPHKKSSKKDEVKTTNENDDDSTTMEESSQLLLSDSSDDNRIDPQAHMNGQGAAGLQLTAVTPDRHICHNYDSIVSCSDVVTIAGTMVVSIGDNTQGLVEAPPYPLKPVDVADNEKCTYCGYMGQML